MFREAVYEKDYIVIGRDRDDRYRPGDGASGVWCACGWRLLVVGTEDKPDL